MQLLTPRRTSYWSGGGRTVVVLHAHTQLGRRICDRAAAAGARVVAVGNYLVPALAGALPHSDKQNHIAVLARALTAPQLAALAEELSHHCEVVDVVVDTRPPAVTAAPLLRTSLAPLLAADAAVLTLAHQPDNTAAELDAAVLYLGRHLATLQPAG